ncbi:MAG: alpha/beta fold hydrolase [Pseudomonadales bacterium]
MKIEVAGETVFYGTGSGAHRPEQPAVIFIHGAGMDHTVWLMPARHFARHGYNVVAVDLPGHGRSTGQALTTVEQMADWVSQVLKALDIASAAVVGHSMGSLIALEFAARFSDQTRSLALLGTSAPMPVSDALLEAAQSDDRAAMVMANTWSHSNPSLIGGHKSPGMTLYYGGLRLLERTREGVYFSDLNACNTFQDGLERAASVTCPALVMIGDQDKMTGPRQAALVAGAIKGAEVVSLSPCGHSMLSEQPNAVLAALKRIV